MLFVIGADAFPRSHKSRLHPLGERLRLGDLDQQLRQLVITADGLTRERDEALVSRGIELATMDRGLIVDPARVVSREVAELIDETLDPLGVQDPAGALLRHEA